MHCEQCGAEIRQGAQFCGSCGTPIPGTSGQAPKRGRRERLGAAIGRTRTERLLAAGTIVAVAIAVVAFFALDTEEPRADAFTKAADSRCVEAKQAIALAGQQTVGSSGSRARIRFTGALVAAVADWMLAFEELDPPKNDSERAGQLSAALLDLSVVASRLNRAARAGDSRAIKTRATAVDRASIRVEEAVAALNLQRCARISLGGSP